MKKSTGTQPKVQTQQKRNKQAYRQAYKEIELIGKGTSGSATLVRHILEHKYYISKKIRLVHLPDSEKEKAQQELKLLQELKHPNIVEFKEAFQDKDQLIIIMEYCEDGDLAFHIKRKQAQNETFKEETILNWLLQMVMAVDYIHSKKVLHRDIKASNIFVSQCGSIKIGDFGISKQLDSTMQMAQTLVGTPYYLSPEVCENKPYTYQSDIWALGCLLYELCALDHPFVSNNLMTLVMKIIKDGIKDIPSIYSRQLDVLNKLMLEKEQQNRPMAQEILCTQIMMDVMAAFIKKKGQVVELVPIRKLNIHQKKDMKNSQMKQSIQQSQKQTQKGEQNISEIEKKVQAKLEKIHKEAKATKNEIRKEKQDSQNPSIANSQKHKSSLDKQEEKLAKMMSNIHNEVQNTYKEVKQSKVNTQQQQQVNNNNNSSNNKNKNNEQLESLKEPPKLQSINKQQQQQQQNNNQKMQESEQTIVSMYQSERKNSDFNFDQTVNSEMQETKEDQQGQLNPFQKAKRDHENSQKLENISEKTDEMSEQNTKSESQINQNNNNNSENQELFPSVQKVQFLNQSLKNPSFYLKNNSLLMDTCMKESDFNMSLTNASAFDFQGEISSKIQELKNSGGNNNLQQQQQQQNSIQNNSFLKDSANLDLSMTASKPFNMTQAQQSFNVSQKTALQTQQLDSKLINKNLTQTTDSLFKDTFTPKNNSNNNQEQQQQQNQELDHQEGKNPFTHTFQFNRPNEINAIQEKEQSKFQMLHSQHSTTHKGSEESDDIDMLEVRDDIGDSSSSDGEGESQLQQEGSQSLTDQEIDEYDGDDKNSVYNERITKNKVVSELDDVLNLYKSQLQQSMTITKSFHNKLLNMTEIKETSAENMFSGSELSKK